MRRNHYDNLINQGRKAGLSTREMYQALTAQHEGVEPGSGRSDSNGYICHVDQGGRVVYSQIGRPHGK